MAFEVASVIIFLVSVISFFLFVIGVMSYRKKRDLRLLSVTAAFGVFFLKNFIGAFGLYFAFIPHGEFELFDSFFDLVAMILLFIPILKKTNNPMTKIPKTD